MRPWTVGRILLNKESLTSLCFSSQAENCSKLTLSPSLKRRLSELGKLGPSVSRRNRVTSDLSS